MKKIKVSLLTLGIFFGSLAFAQPTRPISEKRISQEQPIEMLNNHFGEGLDLTADQKKSIKKIQNDFGEQRQKRLQDKSLDQLNLANEVEKLHQLENQQLWQVLTPEQAKKYKNMTVVPDAPDVSILPVKEKTTLPVKPSPNKIVKKKKASSKKQDSKQIANIGEEQPIEMLNNHFGEGLTLSKSQVAKIDQIRKGFAEERQKILNDEKRDKVQSAQAIEALHQKENEMLWEVLTPAQTKKYKGMRVIPDAAESTISPRPIPPIAEYEVKPMPKQKRMKVSSEQPIEMLNNHFGEGLNLSAAQSNQIKEIQKNFAELRQKKLKEEGLNKISLDREIESLHQMENQKLWEVLTPDQASQYKRMRITPDAAESQYKRMRITPDAAESQKKVYK